MIYKSGILFQSGEIIVVVAISFCSNGKRRVARDKQNLFHPN